MCANGPAGLHWRSYDDGGSWEGKWVLCRKEEGRNWEVGYMGLISAAKAHTRRYPQFFNLATSSLQMYTSKIADMGPRRRTDQLFQNCAS